MAFIPIPSKSPLSVTSCSILDFCFRQEKIHIYFNLTALSRANRFIQHLLLHGALPQLNIEDHYKAECKVPLLSFYRSVHRSILYSVRVPLRLFKLFQSFMITGRSVVKWLQDDMVFCIFFQCVLKNYF